MGELCGLKMSQVSSIFGGILFVYMHGYVQTLFDLPHSESFGSFNRIIIPALMEKNWNNKVWNHQSAVVQTNVYPYL